VTSNTNPPELKLGQVVLHGGLNTLHSDLVDMHKLTHNIAVVMEFQKRLIVKLILGNSVGKSVFLALIGPLKQILSDLNNFCRFVHL
jgi:hypothetical protein